MTQHEARREFHDIIKNMKLNFAISCLLAITVKAVFAADITYKGVPIGASYAEYKAQFQDHKCLSINSCFFSQDMCMWANDGKGGVASSESSGACRTRNSFGGTSALSVNASFRDEKLVQILFSISPRSFESLSDAAKEKLGAPTRARVWAMQNRAGANFQNSEMVWESPTMILKIQRYGSTVDRGLAVLTTPQEQARKINEHENGKKTGAKDF